ncbi:reverse transcriptase [Gossypium australe]|uniref:Reverse transcriptase n=1 Tax=Gossypium australe TaxID=47621 RepID=A0A5B6UTA3_9ROSI|nr:reverse transcriptase [Gossypium australe]
MLVKRFMDEEILVAFNQMDPRKAPGIDGLSGIFFKENWEIVGNDILIFCHYILNGTKDISCINETMIVLIPKIKEPVDMSNSRPINLCRVIYKIIAKTLANHNQSAFVPMIHDNILIVHEFMHYLQSSKNGPNKGLVVKFNMSKAHDRVE